MKKLVATAPRVAALVEYEDRPVAAHEVKIRARYGAPKHGTEVVDYVVYECRVRADDPAQAYKDSLTYLREC
ncbi:hypothetical protein GP710_10935 [Escherichia coli]|nr:hypothetical protein GP710_10935 [Escherichia coli]